MSENNMIKVAQVVNDTTVVINKGLNDGIKKGERFIIYHYGDEIVDPDSLESLGRLEIISGTGIVSNVQDKIATLVSCDKEMISGTRTIKKNSLIGMFGDIEEIKDPTYTTKPFDNPQIGYLVKKVN